MTLNDYIFECENYEHSRDYLEISKQLNEVSLMGRYLENQSFMKEYEVNLKDYAFTEGYFMELRNDNEMETLYESFKGKANALGSRILLAFKRLWKVFISFFYKRTNNLAKDDIQRNELIKTIANDKNFNENEMKLRTIVSKNWKKEYREAGFAIANDQDEPMEMLRNRFNNNLKMSEDGASVSSLIKAVLAKNIVNVRYKFNDKSEDPFPGMSVEDIAEIMKDIDFTTKDYKSYSVMDWFIIPKLLKDPAARSWFEKLSEKTDEILKNSIKVKVGNKSNSTVQKDLRDIDRAISTSIDKLMDYLKNRQELNKSVKNRDLTPAEISAINKWMQKLPGLRDAVKKKFKTLYDVFHSIVPLFLSMQFDFFKNMQTVITKSMKMYNMVDKYRHDSLWEISKLYAKQYEEPKKKVY